MRSLIFFSFWPRSIAFGVVQTGRFWCETGAVAPVGGRVSGALHPNTPSEFPHFSIRTASRAASAPSPRRDARLLPLALPEPHFRQRGPWYMRKWPDGSRSWLDRRCPGKAFNRGRECHINARPPLLCGAGIATPRPCLLRWRR
jgi:hypothetical protein